MTMSLLLLNLIVGTVGPEISGEILGRGVKSLLHLWNETEEALFGVHSLLVLVRFWYTRVNENHTDFRYWEELTVTA